jgi:hypothetical protein
LDDSFFWIFLILIERDNHGFGFFEIFDFFVGVSGTSSNGVVGSVSAWFMDQTVPVGTRIGLGVRLNDSIYNN